MKVPLIAKVNNDSGSTRLDIWANGRKLEVPAPFRPYIFSKKDLGEIRGTASWPVVKRSLSTLQEEEYTCYELENTSQVYQIKRDWEEYLDPLNFAEASMPFIHRILVDDPDYYRQYANTDKLRVLHVDIEQWFDKTFPTKSDPIIAIGIGYNSDDREVLMVNEVTPDEEKRILLEFNEKLVEFDPDIIVGYNLHNYDIPVLFARLIDNGLYPHIFGRTGETEFDEEYGVQVEGRLIYDLYHSVEKDQTLHGIKNRKMKTVAKWFKLKDIKEMPEEAFKLLIGTDKLREYNESDIRITQQLFNIYFPKIEGMAEYLGSPLGELIPFADSFPATIQQARILRSKNIVSDGTNKDRYPDLFKVEVDEDGNETRIKFEGAEVQLMKRGWFRKVYKYDFGSMYPHIMWSIGIGPDNTTLVKLLPLGPFKCWREGDTRYYSVPDNNHGVSFLVKVEGESDVANFIKGLLAQRLELKKRAKEVEKTDPVEFAKIESQQYALKVVLNSVYGQNGAAFLRYGSGPVAILVTCIGRQLIGFLHDMCKDGAIELDTDGLYTDRKYSLDKIVDQLNFFTMFELLGEPVMKVEEDEYEGGWFHRAKNYLLLKKNKDGSLKLVKQGGAFKGSKLPPMFDTIIERVGLCLLVKGPQEALGEARKCLDLSQYGPEDFVQQIRLQKPIEAYSGSVLSATVALDAQRKWGMEPRKGNQYRYLKTIKGYEVYDMEAFSRIDVDYYRQTIEGALDLLGFEKNRLRNKGLDEFC